MMICGGVCILLVAGMWVLRKYPIWEKAKLPLRILFIFGVLGFLTGVSAGMQTGRLEQGKVVRNPPGEGELETEACFYMPQEDTEYQMQLTIPERQYSREEEIKLIAAAIEEINETFCGENPSTEEIRLNPHVGTTYQNGAVRAEWSFSEEDIISTKGEICEQALEGAYQDVEASVELSCGDSEEVYQFSFRIVPVVKSKKERMIADINTQIAQSEATEEVIFLPEYADGEKIQWKSKVSTKPVEILCFGIIAAITVFYTEREQREQKRLKRKRRLLLEYPEFVGKLSLLLGAGMTISKALRKMDQMYYGKRNTEKDKQDSVYMELHRMICEMDNGMGEIRAYQEFAKRCDLQPYRKLMSLLISGQKVGNRRLMEKLNEEADRVFTERKNTARKLGEEAGTKLLFPMMMMMVIIMGIVMIPAFLTIYKM